MQGRIKNKRTKRIIALILCVVMIITSLPLALAAGAGTYDPIPYFHEDGQKDPETAAYRNDNGGVTVNFPAAKARSGKKIDGYFLELLDLGSYKTEHNFDVPANRRLSKWVDVNTLKGVDFSIEFKKADIESVFPKGLDPENRYSVTIIAVDNAGWFSDPIYAAVYNVPDPNYVFTMEPYEPLTKNETAVREMMKFEKGSGSIVDGSVVTGNGLLINGAKEEAGAIDPVSPYRRDTASMQLRITAAPNPGVPVTVDTYWSRETYDADGAQEIWFWMDLSQVDLKGLSFRVQPNKKTMNNWDDKTVWEEGPGVGMTYSTLGTVFNTYPAGQEPYVMVQSSIGGWEKVKLNNGTIDLAHYRGYIRVPIKYLCSMEPTTIQARNDRFNDTSFSRPYNSNADACRALIDTYINTTPKLKLDSEVTVDPAGTPVDQALLIHFRNFSAGYYSGIFNRWNGIPNNPVGNMLAPGVKNADSNLVSNPRRAVVDASGKIVDSTGAPLQDANGNPINRNTSTNVYTAINDLYTAGFAYNDCSADSIDKSFYFDNVMFYRENGAYPENTIDGSTSSGAPLKNYYDQEVEIAKSIFNACDEYFEAPNWSDYRAVAYIQALVENYGHAFGFTFDKNTGCNDGTFLSYASLAASAATMGRTDAWNKFVNAKAACEAGQTIDFENNDPDDLVPMLERELEKLPDPTKLISMTPALKEKAEKIIQIYKKLNYGQLENLGEKAEAKIIGYYTFMEDSLADNSVVVGQMLTDKPFIPFNTFESEPLGKTSWRLENDPSNINNGNMNQKIDYRYKKGFVTWTNRDIVGWAGKATDDTNTSALSADPMMDGFKKKNALNLEETDNNPLLPNGIWADITSNGAAGTKGATVSIDNILAPGSYNVLNVSYQGAENEDPAQLRAVNMGREGIKLGALARNAAGVGPGQIPLSFVCYVDFSKMQNFRFSVNISTYYRGAYDDFNIDMGTDTTTRIFYLLDPDSGEWVECQNPTSAYSLISNNGADTDGDGIFDLTLDNYCGYVMIPLYHFKKGGAINDNPGRKLDEWSEALDTIFRVSIGVCPTPEALAARTYDGRDFTIDNIGFSYDREFYKDQVAARGITDKTFDEQFGVKATTSEKFETIVAGIDPYDDANLSAGVKAAEDAYALLNDYQKSLTSVKNAWEKLELYKGYLNGTVTKPTPREEFNSVDKLVNAINALPTEAKADGNIGSDMNGCNPAYEKFDLYYPGFVTEPDGTVRVNYEAYGFKYDPDDPTVIENQLENVRLMWEEGYKRFSVTDQNSLGASKMQMVNAYQAVARLRELEEMLADLMALEEAVKSVYTESRPEGTNPSFMSIGDESITKLQRIFVQYTKLDYFAKQLLKDGKANGKNPSFQYIPRAIERVLSNSMTYTLSDHTQLKGGIIRRVEEYTMLLDDTADKMAAGTLVDLERIDSVIGEYESFLPAYYSVVEMYDLIEAIKELFPTYKMGFTDGTKSTETLVVASKDGKGSVNLLVTYAEEYPGTTGNASTSYFVITKGTGTEIPLSNAGILYTLSFNGKAIEFGKQIPASDLGILNNTHTAAKPISIPIEADFGTKAPAAPILTDKIYIKHYSADNVETGTYVLTVQYSKGDTYVVSIPASVDVQFNDTTAQTANVTTNHNMVVGSTLKVGLDATNDYTMSRVGDTAKTPVFNYTADFGDATQKNVLYNGAGSEASAVETLTVTVPAAEWKKATVDNYIDETLTFFATYTPRPTS